MILVLVVAWLVLLSVAVGLGLWALTRHNRVSHEHATAAPLSWVVSPARPARMHRRLRTAVGWVERPLPGEPASQHDHLRTKLVDQAVALDLQLVRAARAPRRHRRATVRQLSGGVTEVERLAVRVHGLTRPVGVPLSGMPAASPSVQQNLADLRHHLDLLDAAHRELTDVERNAGLGPAPDLPVDDRLGQELDPRAAPTRTAPVDATRSTATSPEPAPRPTVIDARAHDEPSGWTTTDSGRQAQPG